MWNDKLVLPQPCMFCGGDMPHEHDPAMVEIVKMMGSIQSSTGLQQTIRMNELETRITKLEKIAQNLDDNETMPVTA